MDDKNKNRIKIIAGLWRGRWISFPDSEGLRPTGNRIRETLFNWLMDIVPGSRCLDLFAGSGALGFEAASRGAKEVVLVDQSREVCEYLKKNKQLLKAEQVRVVNAFVNFSSNSHSLIPGSVPDVLSRVSLSESPRLERAAHSVAKMDLAVKPREFDTHPFDIIFIDPPFQKKMTLDVLSFLEAGSYLHEKTLVYVEMNKSDLIEFPKQWTVLKDKTAGAVRAVLLRFLVAA